MADSLRLYQSGIWGNPTVSLNPLTKVVPTPKATPWQHLWSQMPYPISGLQNTDAHVSQAVRSWKNPTGWYDMMWALGQSTWPWTTVTGGKSFGQRCLEVGGWDYPIGGYQNGSYTDQSMKDSLANGNTAINVYEVRLQEAYMAGDTATLGYTPTYPNKRIVQVFWPAHYFDQPTGGEFQTTGARLSLAITASQTTIRVQKVPSANIPPTAPSTWPYYASTAGSNTYSGAVNSAVSWLYIDNPSVADGGEIVRVNAVSDNGDGTLTLTVVRGYWGFTAAARSAGTRIFSPIYIGGQEFMGAPGAYDRGLSTDANAPTRYAGLVDHDGWVEWKLHRYKDIYSFLGGGDLISIDGNNVMLPTLWHQDISSSISYNTIDWGGYLSGYPEKPYHWARDRGDTLNNRDIHYERQMTKFQKYRAMATAHTGWPKVIWQGNSMSPFNDIDETYNRAMEQDFRKWDHSTHEFWLSAIDGTHIPNHLNAMIRAANQTSPVHKALIWAKETQTGWGSPADTQRYRRFAYAMFCMAANPDETSIIFGGNVTAVTPVVGGNPGEPNQLFRFDLGPGSRPTDLADLKVAYTSARGYGTLTGTGTHKYVYRRDLARGVVVANLTDSSYNFTVPSGTWWQVTEDTVTSATGVIAIPTKDALFLCYDLET